MEKKIIVKQANNGMYYAKYEGGGQMPKGLTGIWTNSKELEAKINHYLSKRKPQTTTQRKAAATKKTTAKATTKAQESKE